MLPETVVPKRLLLRSNTTGTCREGHTPRAQLKINITSQSKILSYTEIIEFLKALVSEHTGIPVSKISTTVSLTSYGIDSIGVVRAAQKLSYGAYNSTLPTLKFVCILVTTHPQSF